jgi:uncharacterized heparinase superfamily protein
MMIVAASTLAPPSLNLNLPSSDSPFAFALVRGRGRINASDSQSWSAAPSIAQRYAPAASTAATDATASQPQHPPPAFF